LRWQNFAVTLTKMDVTDNNLMLTVIQTSRKMAIAKNYTGYHDGVSVYEAVLNKTVLQL
jgi:hypothetical protein